MKSLDAHKDNKNKGHTWSPYAYIPTTQNAQNSQLARETILDG